MLRGARRATTLERRRRRRRRQRRRRRRRQRRWRLIDLLLLCARDELAAVGDPSGAVDVARFVAGEEDDRLGDLLGAAHSTQRNFGLDIFAVDLLHCILLDAVRAAEVRDDEARAANERARILEHSNAAISAEFLLVCVKNAQIFVNATIQYNLLFFYHAHLIAYFTAFTRTPFSPYLIAMLSV